MPPSRIAALLSSALLLALPASAAEVTDMPGAMGFDGVFSYGGAFEFGGLEEAGEIVGRRSMSRQDLALTLEFAPVQYVAAHVSLQLTPSLRYGFADARLMNYDPVTASGSYIFGEELAEVPVFQGSGLAGVWLGVVGAPFAERFETGDRVTWKLLAAVRPGSPNKSFYTATDGSRGVGGGTGLRFGAAFSRELEGSNPYMSWRIQHETPLTIDVVDADGVTWIEGATLKPPTTIDVEAGVEVLATEDDDTRFAVDPSILFGYRSWEDAPSGLYLPNVLDASRVLVGTRGEYYWIGLGLALDLRVQQQLGIRVGGDLRYLSPHTIDSIYAVRTAGDTLGATVSMSVRGSYR